MTTAEQVGRFAAFARLTAAQLETVAREARDVEFAAGTTLFQENQSATGCWLICDGRVSLTTPMPAHDQVVVQTLGAGDVLGWSWLVPPHLWHFTATTDTPVLAIELDTTQLRASAERDPALGYPLALGLMEGLLARLQSTRARLLDLYGRPT